MLINDNNEQGAIEKEIATFLAKSFKKTTGKGPRFVKVFLEEEYVLAEIYNILVDVELRMAQTEQGRNDVRLNRYKMCDYFRDQGESAISKISGKKVVDSFWDFNPKTDRAAMVWFFKN